MTASDFGELVLRFQNGEATDAEIRQLFEWVRHSPANAEEFARLAAMHADLRRHFHGKQTAEASGAFAVVQLPDPSDKPSPSAPRPARWKLALICCGCAATLLISLLVSPLRNRHDSQLTTPTEPPANFVTLMQVSNAHWRGSKQRREGERISAGMLRLESGIVRLLFDDGVDVTVQGPADFEIKSPGHTRLSAGLLTATVPPGAEGLRVETPTANVVDLGTSFGIDLTDGGASSIAVFEGEVQIQPHDSDERRLIREGESIQVSADRQLTTIEFDTKPFEKLWPIASGITSSSESFEFAPFWPRRLRFVQSNDVIFVQPEGFPQVLAKPLRVNLTEPGEFSRLIDLAEDEIAAGMRVRSYLLQFNPVKEFPGRRIERIVGEISFRRPVLGLIVRAEELNESDAIFSRRIPRVIHEARQLELSRLGDIVRLSDDRRTVHVDLATTGWGSDHIRVIVNATRREYASR